MLWNKLILSQWLLRGTFFLVVICWSAESAPTSGELSLSELIQNALQRNGQIQESLQDVEIARSQVELAKSAQYPKGNALILAAPIFEETGNALQSTPNWSKWGPLFRGGFELAQPIYSFGMISSYRKAADNQLLAKSELAEVRRNEVVFSTKEFYYSYLMANDLVGVVSDLISFLESAVKTADENLEKNNGSVKKHDVFRLKTALEDLRQKKLYAVQGRKTAERAVAWMSVTDFEKLQTKVLDPEPVQLLKLEEYLRLAKTFRPEFRALTAGQAARAALRDAKAGQSYPIVFVGGFASFAWSPVRERQPSVFANDMFNMPMGGIGVGLRLDLDFKKHSAEASEQEAELMKLKATESYAVPGIELQVKRAFWEVEQAKDGLEIASRRKELAKKWFVGSAMGWSIGLTPAKDLLEAMEGDGLAKKNSVETIFNFNVSLARLSQAVGKEVSQLK